MATTSHTIYSRYDPEKDKERLQRETGQVPDIDGSEEPDSETLWREATSARFLRALRPPPTFVPATISYELGSISEPGPSEPKVAHESPLGNTLSSWYRSLTAINGTSPSTHQPRPSSAPIPTSSSSAPLGEANDLQTAASTRRTKDKKDKNNWFIQRVLRSEPPSTPSTPPPTLADILAREPPPLPSEPKYTPPIWIEIGPWNKGFMMLQKSGWNEGEALGAGARRRSIQESASSIDIDAVPLTNNKGKQKALMAEMAENRTSRMVKQEPHDDFGDIKKEVDLIDLTLSDSDSEASEEEGEDGKTEEPLETHRKTAVATSEASEDISTYGRQALLTPIATVLKLDRLGIGLKAKTEGPYKASVKRVTHNAAALAAHRRAAEEARRRREKFGRGRRGYERQKRREEDQRKNLLAYMNT